MCADNGIGISGNFQDVQTTSCSSPKFQCPTQQKAISATVCEASIQTLEEEVYNFQQILMTEAMHLAEDGHRLHREQSMLLTMPAEQCKDMFQSMHRKKWMNHGSKCQGGRYVFRFSPMQLRKLPSAAKANDFFILEW
jgi:hypothetical protein